MKQSNLFFSLHFHKSSHVGICWFTVNIIFQHCPQLFYSVSQVWLGSLLMGIFPFSCMFLPSPEANLLGVERSTSTSEGLAKALVHKCVQNKCVWHCTDAANLEQIEVDLCCAVIKTARFWVWGREYVKHLWISCSVLQSTVYPCHTTVHSIRSLFKSNLNALPCRRHKLYLALACNFPVSLSGVQISLALADVVCACVCWRTPVFTSSLRKDLDSE